MAPPPCAELLQKLFVWGAHRNQIPLEKTHCCREENECITYIFIKYLNMTFQMFCEHIIASSTGVFMPGHQIYLRVYYTRLWNSFLIKPNNLNNSHFKPTILHHKEDPPIKRTAPLTHSACFLITRADSIQVMAKNELASNPFVSFCWVYILSLELW